MLLLNASLTASQEASRADASEVARHAEFWKPVAEAIIDEILRAKQACPEPRHKGVVFAWWGSRAKSLRATVERLRKKYPGVSVRHIVRPNPAAQGDVFCDNDPFGAIKDALASLGAGPIDWLPRARWNAAAEGSEGSAEAERMGEFVGATMALHKEYLERLGEVKEEPLEELSPILGVSEAPRLELREALAPLAGRLAGLSHHAERAADYARRRLARGPERLDPQEIAAAYLYTSDSILHRHLNAALRIPDRASVKPFFPYLRLLLSALDKLEPFTRPLWRGVGADVRGSYREGRTVTWWGVSSCTSKLSVAHAFLGGAGRRTLFEVRPARAVWIRAYSAFTGEDEYPLAPGTRLEVSGVKTDRSGLTTIALTELLGERLVR